MEGGHEGGRDGEVGRGAMGKGMLRDWEGATGRRRQGGGDGEWETGSGMTGRGQWGVGRGRWGGGQRGGGDGEGGNGVG